jgi:hypothetical protein
MENDSLCPANFPDFLNGHDRSGLVIGKHDCDQDGIRPDGAAELIQVNQPFDLPFPVRESREDKEIDRGVIAFFFRKDQGFHSLFQCISFRSLIELEIF